MTFEYDENGNLRDYLSERNEQIINSKRMVNTVAKVRELQIGQKKTVTYGNIITTQLYAELEKYPLLTAKEIALLDDEMLQYYFTNYLELISHYVEFELSTTKPLFCQYLRITVDDFLQMLNGSNSDPLKRYAQHIDDVISGLAFSQAETGNGKSSAILTRARIKDIGQNMIVNADPPIVITEEIEDPALALERVRETKRLLVEKNKKK